ncbi:Mu transposase C-terminal domain-containing protein [Cytobacillus oceanisediminis]|uniref:Mu transposase C-terminal domain-containing protein n=1 Tax=Cytobacillus oceanisediminis TaxID=665099 RepID=UPI0011AA65B9|nr:Mu transposase C-terminal domain-containing protein [Cytobacillus oceanisediminis]
MNQLFENTLIEFKDDNGSCLAIERVLWIAKKTNECVTINILDKNPKPKWTECEYIVEAINKLNARILTYDPYLMDKCVKEPSEKDKRIRDEAWKRIKDIVDLEPNIYGQKERGEIIGELIRTKGYHSKTINNDLRRYWKSGKTINGLLPLFSKCGAPGVERESKTGKKRGRKRKIEQVLKMDIGINIDEEMKKIFRVAIKLHYSDKRKNPLKYAYDKMIEQFFNIGYKEKAGERIPVIPPEEELPTLDQFKYYFYKERNLKDILIKREGERKFNLTRRAAVGNAGLRASGPGAVYEIDATTGDFQLVHSINRKPIGRPIIYYVKDVFSRMIAGLYIGTENASWVGGMLAFENASTDKVEFCKNFDITITSDEWPCMHLPKSFTADRGEFEGYNADRLKDMLGVRPDNTPPYRGDFKPFIEQHFRIMNNKSKPIIPGVVSKSVKERGEKDSRLNAVLTIKEFTKIMILIVLEYNNSIVDNYPLDRDMLEQNLVPTPLNLWNWGMQNRFVGVHIKTKDQIRLALMPRGTATVTHDNGIFFNKNKIGYTSVEVEEAGWFVKARQKRWKVPISYDPRNQEYIYILKEDAFEYIPCKILPQYSAYKDLYDEEIELTQLTVAANNFTAKPEINNIKAALNVEIDKTVKEGIKKTEAIRGDVYSDRELLQGVKENKKDERERERAESSWVLGEKEKREMIDTNESSAQNAKNNIEGDTSSAISTDELVENEDLFDLFNSHLSRRKINNAQ